LTRSLTSEFFSFSPSENPVLPRQGFIPGTLVLLDLWVMRTPFSPFEGTFLFFKSLPPFESLFGVTFSLARSTPLLPSEDCLPGLSSSLSLMQSGNRVPPGTVLAPSFPSLQTPQSPVRVQKVLLFFSLGERGTPFGVLFFPSFWKARRRPPHMVVSPASAALGCTR